MGDRSPSDLVRQKEAICDKTSKAVVDEVIRRDDLDYDETERRKRFPLRPTVAKKCKYSL